MKFFPPPKVFSVCALFVFLLSICADRDIALMLDHQTELTGITASQSDSSHFEDGVGEEENTEQRVWARVVVQLVKL